MSEALVRRNKSERETSLSASLSLDKLLLGGRLFPDPRPQPTYLLLTSYLPALATSHIVYVYVEAVLGPTPAEVASGR